MSSSLRPDNYFIRQVRALNDAAVDSATKKYRAMRTDSRQATILSRLPQSVNVDKMAYDIKARACNFLNLAILGTVALTALRYLNPYIGAAITTYSLYRRIVYAVATLSRFDLRTDSQQTHNVSPTFKRNISLCGVFDLWKFPLQVVQRQTWTDMTRPRADVHARTAGGGDPTKTTEMHVMPLPPDADGSDEETEAARERAILAWPTGRDQHPTDVYGLEVKSAHREGDGSSDPTVPQQPPLRSHLWSIRNGSDRDRPTASQLAAMAAASSIEWGPDPRDPFAATKGDAVLEFDARDSRRAQMVRTPNHDEQPVVDPLSFVPLSAAAAHAVDTDESSGDE